MHYEYANTNRKLGKTGCLNAIAVGKMFPCRIVFNSRLRQEASGLDFPGGAAQQERAIIKGEEQQALMLLGNGDGIAAETYLKP
jgi:hypothetical protein